jgi:transposase-like protein
MRKREKLTPEERFALALDLIKREHSFAEVCSHYHVSHTTAYKIRNAFLEGGRRALAGARARESVDPIAEDTDARSGSDAGVARAGPASPNGGAVIG